ncbi:tetratricopeptide repeat-containing sulfotransferase family protein [Umboniibacter marinipuniceus]|uniref:Tfp pilus assembly protein PilF n=1 Tax=Umboniibacter marinipuniceus TaxID=569599 RepID=A0A3M0A192_9GAMM|nr:tetratricopeptide repeat-containing sulfotransferase family protein [Umboniibacter marinipuniceus]RMA78723.1 Tfp pilus assembly protein PilF [Umboniibacter marinipuniceus]
MQNDALRNTQRLLSIGNTVEAIESLEASICSENPDHHALELLGGLLLNSGQITKAQRYLSSVQAADIKSANLARMAGYCAVQFGEAAQAISYYRIASEMLPEDLDIQVEFATALRIGGKFGWAKQQLQSLLDRAPDNTLVLDEAGWLALAQGKYRAAAQAFTKSISAEGPTEQRLNGIIRAYIEINDLKHAGDLLLKARQEYPQSTDLLHLEAVLLTKLKEFAAAYDCYQAILAATPDKRDSQLNLGVLAAKRGELEFAETLFTRIIDTNPADFEAWYQLASLDQNRLGTELLNRFEQHCAPFQGSARYWFVCAKLQHQSADYSASFSSTQRARELQLIDEGCEVSFPRQYNLSDFTSSNEQTKPSIIFVTGMPRSGTTLTQRIISQHERCIALGETGVIQKLIAELNLDPSAPQAYLGTLSGLQKQRIADNLRQDLLPGDGAVAVEHTPINVFYIPIIAELLPEARFVICERERIDNCLSIYQQSLSREYRFANSPAVLAEVWEDCHRLTRQLCDAWRERVYCVQYEQLVQAPETIIPELLNALNLPFDGACLMPESGSDWVHSPNLRQARRAIHCESVDKRSRYGSAIHPFLAELAQ